MKYVVDITELPTCPDEWTSQGSWPGHGVYSVRDEPRYVYFVGKERVFLIYDGSLLTSTPYREPPETVAPKLVSGCINESLFLRAIAAASRGEVVE